jgi:hypothetical protein
VDEKGNVLETKTEEPEDINSKILNDKNNGNGEPKKEQKQYTPIGSYKPTGKLVYGQEVFDKIEKKVVFT